MKVNKIYTESKKKENVTLIALKKYAHGLCIAWKDMCLLSEATH